MTIASFVRWTYGHLLKPVLFLMNPEWVHRRFIGIGRLLGSNFLTRFGTSLLFCYRNSALEQRICGLRFTNPVGLAGGFDKDGRAARIFSSVGFGFTEIGSMTARPCSGNAGKHLWRLPKSRGIVVYYGLKNEGAEVIARRMRGVRFNIPLGINIARTNDPMASVSDEAGIADYVSALHTCADFGDYVTINVSCPNSYGGEAFSNPPQLDLLLSAVDELGFSKPVFIKLGADISFSTADGIIAVARKHRVSGFILTNLTKAHGRQEIVRDEFRSEMKGGVSGKPVELLANELISHVYAQTGDAHLIIGCGGVFSAEDAYEKILRGASLVQLITGMIFEGPQLIGEINQGLVALLKRDGFSNISEAVGSRVRKSVNPS